MARYNQIIFLLSDKEKRELKSNAWKNKMSMGEYIRKALDIK